MGALPEASTQLEALGSAQFGATALNDHRPFLSSIDKETTGQNVPVLPALGLRLADEDLQKAQWHSGQMWEGSSVEKYPTSHEHVSKPVLVDVYTILQVCGVVLSNRWG